MKAVSTICHLFRVGEWYDSKVPMLILPALYSLIILDAPFSKTQLYRVLILIVFDSLFLAFGYLINDYADIEVDKMAGKKKIMHQVPKWAALLLIIGTVICGCLPILIVNHSVEMILALAVIYFFGGSYSAPPLRFKERGAAGLLVSSTAQRCFPLLPVCMLLELPFQWQFGVWVLLSFFVGLRYILVHQYIDAENDRRSGVETFALEHQKSVSELIIVSFVIELLCVAVLMIPIGLKNRWTILVFFAYVVLALIRWRGCIAVYGHGGFYSFDQVPLEDCYNQWMPLFFILLLIQNALQWSILLVIWLVFLLRATVEHMKFPARYFGDQVFRRRKEKRNEG